MFITVNLDFALSDYARFFQKTPKDTALQKVPGGDVGPIAFVVDQCTLRKVSAEAVGSGTSDPNFRRFVL